MNSEQPPIFILGLGCIATPGHGPEQLAAAIEAEWTPPVADEWSIAERPSWRVAAIAGFDPADYIQLRGLRPLSRASRLSCVAAAAALGHPAPLPGPTERLATVVGTRWGSIEPLVEFNRTAITEGPHLVNPAHFPNVVVNVHAGYLGILFGLAGPNVTLCGPGAGLEALGHGTDLILLDQADFALAGGVEALGITLLHGLARSGEPDDPAPGEGAAFILLGRRSTPERSALARFGGWATGTAHRPHEAAAVRTTVLGRALRAAGIASEVVESVWATGDAAAHATLGTSFPSATVRSLHRTTGNCQAADGALAAVLAADHVARGGGPALVTGYPRLGPQTAALFLPP